MWYQLISDIGARYFPLLLQTPVCLRNVCAFVWGHYNCEAVFSSGAKYICTMHNSSSYWATQSNEFRVLRPLLLHCYNAVHSCVIINQFKTKCKSNVAKIWYIPAPPCVRWKLNWLHLYFSYFLQGHICISPQQLIRISQLRCNAQGCKYLDFFSRLSTLALQHLNYLLSYSCDCHEQHIRIF